MSVGVLGRKLGMTQVYDEEGRVVPVTVVQAGPCPVVEIKRPEKDGYSSLKIGFEEVKPHKLNKAERSVFEKRDLAPCRILREFRVSDASEYEEGQVLTVSLFETGEKINVVGTSKGKGFAGVMKRHGFGGAPASHGVSKTHRKPGSIGGASYPGKVFKGKTMPGRMGNERVTVKNLSVVAVYPDNNLLLIKGAIPGARNSLVQVVKQG